MFSGASLRWASLLLAAPILLFPRMIGASGEGAASDRRSNSANRSGAIEGVLRYREAKRTWRYARYYVRNPKGGELAEAVVALSGPDLKRFAATPVSRVTSIDQRDMRFVPETAAIRAGDRVRFTNSDPQTHNVSTHDARFQFSDTIGNGQEAVETFRRPSGIRRPFALGCAIHSQMQGWIYVFDHPFFQITGADGRFRLSNVPPGKYRIDVAHSAGGLNATRTVEVTAGETAAIEIVLTPDDRTSDN